MSRLLPLAVSLAITVTLSAASSQETPDAAAERQLVGEWQGNVNTAGALARMTLSLFRDGTYVKRVVFINEFAWATSDDTTLLIARPETHAKKITLGPPMSMHMSVSDSFLVVNSGNDFLKFRRFTPFDPQAPLIGRWHGESDLGEELTEDFAPDGRLFVSVTLTREAGMFSVKRGAIEWEVQLPNSAMHHEKFRIDGNKLKIFVNSEQKPMVWERAPYQLVDNKTPN